MAIKFHEVTRHGRQTLMPGIAYGFADPDAEPYFIKAFGAKKTNQKAVHTFSAEEISVDAETVFADGPNKGDLVMEKARG